MNQTVPRKTDHHPLMDSGEFAARLECDVGIFSCLLPTACEGTVEANLEGSDRYGDVVRICKSRLQSRVGHRRMLAISEAIATCMQGDRL